MQITAGRLLRAGFRLTDCDDGKFWVLAEQPGREADRIAAVCRRYLEDVDSTAVAEDIVLQCDEDFQNPVFYMDGFLWQLERGVFSGIVARLSKNGSGGGPRTPENAGNT